MSPNEFEQAFRRLLAEHGERRTNVGCLACDDCERCTDSTFLKRCKNVARSHYCEDTVDSSECSHCQGCTGCVSCSHCERCDRCTQSAYLIRCVAMSGCTYCFGCVGLFKKDFHILNEPYDRQTYFERVGELRRMLRI